MKSNQTAFLKLCLADAFVQLLEVQPYEDIQISAICKKADVGRSTFYRHLGSKAGKEELLVFKLQYDWRDYANLHREELETTDNTVMAQFIYERRSLFRLIYQNGLIIVFMKFFESLFNLGEEQDKGSTYLRSFLAYGYFGLFYQWMKLDFDETPEQLHNRFANGLINTP